ncbi:hypothetical protein [Mucilaginibacter antarcticus]|uniref:hypothetical protein n=1 Tax=Mucilaginibacter antarcticus TaxID=1855725 RepID=UPI00362E264A
MAFFILLVTGFTAQANVILTDVYTVGKGKQPQISVDNAGIVRVVYGLDDKVLCATSTDHAKTFGNPVLVAQVPGMHLGMGRGPQLASSGRWSIVTVMDQAGDIHWFKQSSGAAKWQAMGIINDMKGSAPEGMMAIGADNKDNFYAVWLDVRIGKRNQICFSSLSAKSGKWAANRIIYQSPDMHVCECCKPSIAVAGNTVAVMFRNWINGSRDLYTLKSVNGGQSFLAAQKMGLGTWKLDGCPMDGGDIRIGAKNQVQTTWQRKGEIYFAQDGDPEVYIGKGKTCSLTGKVEQPVITYKDRDTLKMMALSTKKASVIGEGDFAKSVQITKDRFLFVWEQAGQIRSRLL